MTGGPLRTLSLTAFRGSTETFAIRFEKGRKLTLIYGENGSGKTTLCDAFELLAVGDVGSLKGRGLGSGLTKYWASTNRKLADIEIVLETNVGAEACTGRVAGSQVTVVSEAHRPVVELLRQQQITRLIEAAPGDRYKALQGYIDISGVEQSEDTLRKSLGDAQADLSRAQNIVVDSHAVLHDQFDAAGTPGGLDAVAWAEALLAKPAGDADAELKALVDLRAALTALALYPGQLAERSQSLQTASAAAAIASQSMAEAVVAASAAAPETVDLLEAASAYLHDHTDPATCPVCQSGEKAAGLAESIAARLTQLTVVRDAKAMLDRTNQALARSRDGLAQLADNYAKTLTDYATAKAAFVWGPHYVFPAIDPPAGIDDLEPWLKGAETASQHWANTEAGLRQGAERIRAVKAAFDRYRSNLAAAAEADALIPHIERAVGIFTGTRQAFTDKIMAEIAQDVGELYEKVHPDEGLDKIALQLDPKKRSSVDMQASFSGSEVPPAAYFSQSHLDTLGLCVFLAMALRDSPDSKILILDDVLGSVDEPHVERVIRMLYGVSERFRHTIITTHYRPWREKYRWGELNPDQHCQFVELARWTIEAGLRSKSTLPQIARLRDMLAADDPDLQAITSKAGVILEEMLDYLTLKYGCAVPRRMGEAYTLGDLLPAINSKLLTALRVEVATPGADPPVFVSRDLKPMLDALSTIAQTRNVMGAHFNKLSFDLYDEDALKFARAVEALADALVCPDHGWPGRKSSGSYWSNGGDTRRLHPLQKPG